MTAEYVLDNQMTLNRPRRLLNAAIQYQPTNSYLPCTTHIQQLAHIPRNITELTRMPEGDYHKLKFEEALKTELDSIFNTGTYQLSDKVDLIGISPQSIAGSKVILNIKYDSTGQYIKHKCRLVFRGDKWYDHYHNKTYAGTVMSETVRLFLSVVAAEDLEMGNVDVTTAFLNADIHEDQLIYIRRPAGFTDQHMPAVIRLRKCLYGQKFAPAKFRDHSDNVIKGMGFQPTVSDPRLYTKIYEGGSKAFIIVHVDDFGIAAATIAIRDEIMQQLRDAYNITEHLEMSEYLGLSISRDRNNRSLTVRQPGYVSEMIETYSIPIEHCPLTPMLDVPRLGISETNPLLTTKECTLYQSKVGTILYLANQTRPDILYAVNNTSRYTKTPTKHDMARIDRICHYIAGTPHLGLTLGSIEGVRLYATVDASYGTHDDRKSHSGCTLHIGKQSGAFISRSKKQTVMADSSTVAEFMATHLAAKEIIWSRNILEEMGYKQEQPTILAEDNQSTIAMINNDCNSNKTKHIEIRFNLIREQVQLNNINMEYLDTSNMTSDILTKALGPKAYLYLRPKILGMAVHSQPGMTNQPGEMKNQPVGITYYPNLRGAIQGELKLE